LPLVRGLSAKGWELFILPEANLREVAIIDGVSLVAARSLGEITGWLQNGQPITPHPKTPWQPGPCAGRVDLAEIKGQAVAKRALEIAAAGRHNVLFMGCPGTGKSMLAQALPSIMPAWTVDEALDASQVHSLLSADESGGLLASRPFRSPHHTTSPAALIGGGDVPMPGEISLAHRGVLFLDELPEFRRDALEALRQPLEEGWVHVNRARGRASYPSDFLLVAAMNPCPCGNRGHPKKECLCSAYRIERYLGRLSAPLVDRIDLHVELPVLDVRELFGESGQSETSGCVRERVERAWRIQRDRHARRVVRAAANARLRPHDLQRVCALDSAGLSLLRLAVDRLGLSARAFDKIRRMARTIADLDGAEAIADRHISEAVQYRALDRSRPVR
ncbi:MAG TPA: YifB family Mg chelatase-like AAA ATPase, partial [Elusimicrobiota bacterium]|nr:YifB family Mg chelatase-like AAA ATPase [Elusimicrobiota bacterium]